jgi:hypothetical protein
VSGPVNLETVLTAWAANEPSVQALVLIGSRVRASSDGVWQADAQSDWDFQIITSRPELFSDAAWVRALPGVEVRVYAVRGARLGDVPKVAAVFTGAEADFVILPAARLVQLRTAASRGEHREAGHVRRDLQSIGIVIRPGVRFLKDTAGWESFYQKIVGEVPDARLENAAACGLADGFVCDFIWAQRKLARGEWIAAQRMLHRELAEANLRLLHELKLRRGERSFPEGRRIERVAKPEELAGVAVSATLDEAGLRAALEKCAATLRELMGALVGDGWRWPDVK